jgi:hypothetical protein
MYIMGGNVMKKNVLHRYLAWRICLYGSIWISISGVLSGCASWSTMQSCQSLAYQQAPTVYDNSILLLPRSCQFGWIGAGPPMHGLGMAYDPMVCDQIKQSHDLNFDARRAIFDACMRGEVATNLPPITPLK